MPGPFHSAVSASASPTMLLHSSGGARRLLVLFVRSTAAATAAGSTNPFQPQLQPHAACFPHRYFSSVPASRRAGSESFDTTASYLVASCGLSPAAAALIASRGVRIVSMEKADASLALLRRYGFSDAEIALLIRRAPKVLIVDPDKILRPKLEFFASLGFSAGSLATGHILERSLNKHLVPYVEFLRGILGTDANIRLAVSRHPYAFAFNLERMRPALQALRHNGLSEDAISKLVLVGGIGVLRLSPDRIAGIFKDLDALGIPSSDSRFVYCFRGMVTINRDTWLRKVALYRSLGVSEGDLLRAFTTQPTIMTLSDEKIRRKIRFFLDELNLDLSSVMRRPVLLAYSLDKCILPRCAVLNVLMREGKIEPGINLAQALLGSSQVFLKRYVLSYADDVPDVVEACKGKIKFEGFKDRMI